MMLLGVFLLLLDTVAATPDTRQAVLVHKDGRFEAVSGALIDSAGRSDLTHAWVPVPNLAPVQFSGAGRVTQP